MESLQEPFDSRSRVSATFFCRVCILLLGRGAKPARIHRGTDSMLPFCSRSACCLVGQLGHSLLPDVSLPNCAISMHQYFLMPYCSHPGQFLSAMNQVANKFKYLAVLTHCAEQFPLPRTVVVRLFSRQSLMYAPFSIQDLQTAAYRSK